MKQVLPILSALFLFSCNIMEDSVSVRLTEYHISHGQEYGDTSYAVTPFDTRLAAEFTLRGTRMLTNTVSDSTLQDSMSLTFFVEKDTVLANTAGDFILPEIRTEDLSESAWSNIVLGLQADSLSPFWETVTRESKNDSSVGQMQSFIEDAGARPLEELVALFREEWEDHTVSFVQAALESDSLYYRYRQYAEENEEAENAYQPQNMEEWISAAQKRNILEENGAPAASLSPEQEVYLRYFNLQFLYFGIIKSRFTHNLKFIPSSLQHRIVYTVSTRWSDEGIMRDSLRHVIAFNRNRFSWVSTQFPGGKTLRHIPEASMGLTQQKNVTRWPHAHVPLIPFPKLSESDYERFFPVRSIAYTPFQESDDFWVIPLGIQEYGNFHAPSLSFSSSRAVTGTVEVFWDNYFDNYSTLPVEEAIHCSVEGYERSITYGVGTDTPRYIETISLELGDE
ncbi:MAG: hypothetical protein ACQEQ4_04550 [Fibrobacterota bacterium]